MSRRSQHGQQKHASHKPGHDAPEHERGKRRHQPLIEQHARGVSAHTEKGRGTEVDDARIAELNVQPKHGDGVAENGSYEEEAIVIVTEEKQQNECGNEKKTGPQPLVMSYGGNDPGIRAHAHHEPQQKRASHHIGADDGFIFRQQEHHGKHQQRHGGKQADENFS